MSQQILDRTAPGALADGIAVGAAGRRRQRARRLLWPALGLAMAGAAGWYGWTWWTTGRFVASTNDAYVGGDVTSLSPHVPGFVARILVADNQYVRGGQTLIELDDRDYAAAAAHAQAAVQADAARIANLVARHALQQSIVREADADLTARQADAAFMVVDAARYREMAQSAAGSRQNSERASAADRKARAAVRSAEAALAAGTQQLVVLDTEAAEAKAGLAQTQADLRTAELRLGYTRISAPIDGYVGDRTAQVGAYMTAGTALLSIVPARGLWVDANFKEDDLAGMRPGQPATVVADVLPGHRFRGHVASVAPATGAIFSVIPPENATGNFTKIVQRVPVRIRLDDGDTGLALLRPGLSATVSVDTRGRPSGQ